MTGAADPAADDDFVADLPFRPRAEIEAIQRRRLARTLDLCFERHPFYHRRWAEAGLARGDIGGPEDLWKLPVTVKRDLAGDPEAFRLETEGLEAEAQVAWDVMHTTGTSGGRPTPFHSTAWDFYGILTANRRALEIRGVRGDDVIANLCPLTLYPYGAFHRTIAAAAAMKIPVVSLLPGRPSPHFHWSAGLDEVVEGVARTRATILWGVASYVRRVILRAEELGADFSAVRHAFVTGEPVSEALRADMTDRLERLGARSPRVSVSYAATEMQVGAVECAPGSGYHNPAPDEFLFEVVDPETHRPVPEGERGLVVVTHLNRRGTVLVRYLLGDTSRMTTEPCPRCGATTERLVELPHRADDLLKIRGMLVDPAVLLGALVGLGLAEYQVVVDRETSGDPLSMDRLTVRAAPAGGAAADAELADRIAGAVKEAVGVRPRVDFAERSEIWDPDRTLKSRRIVDARPPAR